MMEMVVKVKMINEKKNGLYHTDCTVFDTVYGIYVVFDVF